MTSPNVYGVDGRRVNLGAELGRGGEGVVYTLRESELDCAKVFHRPLEADATRKLELMVQDPPHDPAYDTLKHRSITWPGALLFARAGGPPCVGFTMPRIDMRAFKKALTYFNAVDRNRLWGCSFTWKHLYTAAFNVTSAIAAIHERRYCIGDLNESNVLIAFNTLVTLIDCDSFQARDPKTGTVYRCTVGKGEYTAPELQGQAYRAADRTLETDSFALGVFLFQLLMDGTHPYQARGPLVDDAPTTEAKIVKGFFPYVTSARGIAPPEYALPYTLLHPDLQRLFERTFVAGHDRPGVRPSAPEWFDTLIRLRGQFAQCANRGTHVYFNHLPTCPWCELVQAAKRDLFPSPLGQQIPMEDATVALESPERRLAYLGSYLAVALADGTLSPQAQNYIAALGARLQIPRPDVDRLIRQEVGKQRATVLPPAAVRPSLAAPGSFAELRQRLVYLGLVGGALAGLLVDNALAPVARRATALVAAVLGVVGGLIVGARERRSPVGAVVGSIAGLLVFALVQEASPLTLMPLGWAAIYGSVLYVAARPLLTLHQQAPMRALRAAGIGAVGVAGITIGVGAWAAASQPAPREEAPRPVTSSPPFTPLPEIYRPDSGALVTLRTQFSQARDLFDQGRYAAATATLRAVQRDAQSLALRYHDNPELRRLEADSRTWLTRVRDACLAEQMVARRRGATPPTCS